MNYKWLLILACLPAASHAADEKSEFLQMMVPGEYTVVGKTVDSDQTYHGEVSISQQDNILVVKRNINGKQTVGKGAIESAVGGDAKVLRIRYAENNINYEETCLVGSDLDNYARISCYVYQKAGKTKQPGLETFFIKH